MTAKEHYNNKLYFCTYNEGEKGVIFQELFLGRLLVIWRRTLPSTSSTDLFFPRPSAAYSLKNEQDEQ